jgi:hypothetical protein
MANKVKYNLGCNSAIINTAIFNATFNQQMLWFFIEFTAKQKQHSQDWKRDGKEKKQG